jgi:signal transduction histidine kinase/AraC-like DNA-binding protein/CheY-like chemotaxis protein
MKAFGGRTSVGLVLASLHTGASVAAWPGVARAAERLGVNLFCFPGGRLGLRAGYEASRNAVYGLASGSPLDGALVWASSLCGAGEPALDDFMDGFRGMALASLSSGVSGVPVVTIDYYGGMREALAHADLVHGYRRIAFLRGPAGHPGAEERLRAFADSLRERGLEGDPRLLSSPFPWDSGGAAVEELLDGRGLSPGRDFEAIVASSDLMALAAAKVLQSRGYRVPEDVALIGMNNGVESRIAAPPLTTVDCPFAELGELGLETLVSAIAAREAAGGPTLGGPTLGAAPPVPAPRLLKTRLVVRRSCGCDGDSALPPAAGIAAGSPASAPDLALVAAEIAAEAGLGPEQARDWALPLAEAWTSAAGGYARFLDLFGRVLDRAARAGMDLAPWQRAITVLRRSGAAASSPSGRDAVEETAGRARALVGEAAERAHSFRAWERERVDLELRELDHELLMALDARRIGDILRRSLPMLGIRSAYVCRYEEGELPKAAGMASLLAAFRDGEELGAQEGAFPAACLVPPLLLPERRFSFVVEPLFFRDSAIGYALFELGEAAGAIYERLRDSVSGALRSFILFERAEEARTRAEKADGIKTRLLASVTHELRAPVDMILRGAARLLEEKEELGLGAEAVAELDRITLGAEHERALVGDLLDFSRAEIDALDIERSPVDAAGLLREAFGLFASRSALSGSWELDLPDRMPALMADPLRLRQIIVNLLSNAERHGGGARVRLQARVEPPDLVLRVSDSGPGIAADRLPHIFEPFLSQGSGGVGLGLSIARHLALLHYGSLEAANAPGGGAVFTLSLPLPDAAALSKAALRDRAAGAGPCIAFISSSGEAPGEIAAAAAARGLALRRLRIKDLEDGSFEGSEVAAIAWDPDSAGAEELALFRKLRARPRLACLPFLLYGDAGGTAAFLDKGSGPSRLAEALALALTDVVGPDKVGPDKVGPDSRRPEPPSIVAADDDEAALRSLALALAETFPGAQVLEARDGEEAWALLKSRKPLVAVLDVSMPGLSGIEVAKLMRSDERLRAVPVVLLTSKVISMEDVRSIEASSRVILGNKGVLSDDEAAAEASRMASGSEALPPGGGALVKRCVAFMNARYSEPIARWQLAEAVNASEDYLARLFRKELGLSPWDYLTRLRVERAKERLAKGSESVAAVGARVGFPDQAYFSRVFKKVTGISPQAYRASPDSVR